MLLWESILVQGVVLWVYCGHHFWYRGGTVGIILVQGGELWGTGGNHFLVKRGVQWVAFLVQGVVVWVYCGKQFLVLRVCTMGGTFDTEGICGHPCLVLWQ